MAGNPPSGLMLCGVPVEAIGAMTPQDFASSRYAAVGYQARRPPGTPLLPAPAPRPPDGPSSYLRGALVALLGSMAAGATGAAARNAATDQDYRTYAELHMSLVETASKAASGALRAPPPPAVPSAPASLGAPFAVTGVPLPAWLEGAIALSRARTTIVVPAPAPPSPSGSTGAGADPVQFANSDSNYWQDAQPLFDSAALASGQARVAAFAAAVSGASPLDVPESQAPGEFPAAAPPPDWLAAAAASLVGKLAEGVGAGGPVAAPTMTSQGLEDLLIARYSEGQAPPPPPGGAVAFVFTPATAAAVLSTVDVMGDFYVGNLRG